MSSASAPAASARLFKPVTIGKDQIHRIAMAPLTRFRAENETHVPRSIVPEYYHQRASPGGLIITEATFIAKEAAGYPTAPGIYAKEQIEQWKVVSDGIHKKGGKVYLQLWALGRANQGQEQGVETVSASNIPLKDTSIIPKELSVDDIKRYVGLYRQAALNAIEAGMDGVEIHAANGYLLDQFNQTNSNKRTDNYGGSNENRARFVLEVAAAVTEAIGAEKTGLRLSPWSVFQDMGMANPVDYFGYLTKELLTRHQLSYIHFVEPVEWSPGTFHAQNLDAGVRPTNDYFRAIARGIDLEKIQKDDGSIVFPDPDASHPTAFLSAGGFKPESAISHAERTGDVVTFGRLFISTPDLPYRVKKGIELTQYDRSTFYTPGPEGYLDWKFATEESEKNDYTLIEA